MKRKIKTEDIPVFLCEEVLKSDIFGSIEKGIFTAFDSKPMQAIRRVYSKHFLFRPLSRFFGRNEKRALYRLKSQGTPYFPELLYTHSDYHVRTYFSGDMIYNQPSAMSAHFFSECKKLLKALRCAGVINNDLAKESNWLVNKETGLPVVSDFQLAYTFKRNHKLARILAREDLRHLLKHQRKYLGVSAFENNILSKKSFLSHVWANTYKRAHRFITRKCLGWAERSGPQERDI